jgi:UDP-glucose-4-epimerase GalE
LHDSCATSSLHAFLAVEHNSMSGCCTRGLGGGFHGSVSAETTQRPINPYGASKLMTERMIQDFSGAHCLRYAVLRYFNASGADPDNEVGESHSPETHLIPLVLDVASRRRPNITVFGSDYETPDGTCIRDYVHVSDLAAAHVCALEALEQGRPSSAYNLGNGNGSSVLAVVDAARRVTGCSIPVVRGARRAGDPAILTTNATKARLELGWQPAITDLEKIIATAWRWHQGNDRT